MIIELDTDIFNLGSELSINKAVFLTLVMNKRNQTNYQGVHEFLSRISEDEIQELIANNYITKEVGDEEITYSLTEETKSKLDPDRDLFDQFYEAYPIYVTRPDGTKGFLRGNVNKCRKEYNKVVGKSKLMHEHIIDCLALDIQYKMETGKMGYFKTMWKWITQQEWELLEQQMEEANKNNENVPSYGSTII